MSLLDELDRREKKCCTFLKHEKKLKQKVKSQDQTIQGLLRLLQTQNVLLEAIPSDQDLNNLESLRALLCPKCKAGLAKIVFDPCGHFYCEKCCDWFAPHFKCYKCAKDIHKFVKIKYD